LQAPFVTDTRLLQKDFPYQNVTIGACAVSTNIGTKPLIDDQKKVSSFPIHEYWRDIGQIDDFQTAFKEFGGLFSV